MPKSYTVVVVFQTLFSIVVGVLRESGNPSGAYYCEYSNKYRYIGEESDIPRASIPFSTDLKDHSTRDEPIRRLPRLVLGDLDQWQGCNVVAYLIC